MREKSKLLSQHMRSGKQSEAGSMNKYEKQTQDVRVTAAAAVASTAAVTAGAFISSPSLSSLLHSPSLLASYFSVKLTGNVAERRTRKKICSDQCCKRGRERRKNSDSLLHPSFSLASLLSFHLSSLSATASHTQPQQQSLAPTPLLLLQHSLACNVCSNKEER